MFCYTSQIIASGGKACRIHVAAKLVIIFFICNVMPIEYLIFYEIAKVLN